MNHDDFPDGDELDRPSDQPDTTENSHRISGRTIAIGAVALAGIAYTVSSTVDPALAHWVASHISDTGEELLYTAARTLGVIGTGVTIISYSKDQQ